MDLSGVSAEAGEGWWFVTLGMVCWRCGRSVGTALAGGARWRRVFGVKGNVPLCPGCAAEVGGEQRVAGPVHSSGGRSWVRCPNPVCGGVVWVGGEPRAGVCVHCGTRVAEHPAERGRPSRPDGDSRRREAEAKSRWLDGVVYIPGHGVLRPRGGSWTAPGSAQHSPGQWNGGNPDPAVEELLRQKAAENIAKMQEMLCKDFFKTPETATEISYRADPPKADPAKPVGPYYRSSASLDFHSTRFWWLGQDGNVWTATVYGVKEISEGYSKESLARDIAAGLLVPEPQPTASKPPEPATEPPRRWRPRNDAFTTFTWDGKQMWVEGRYVPLARETFFPTPAILREHLDGQYPGEYTEWEDTERCGAK